MTQIDDRDETIICESTDGQGICICMSEKTASRISLILTGGVAILTMPIIILAFMMG